MLTKTTKTVTKTIEVEEEVFNLELTKEQLIELLGLLGNCSSVTYGNSLYHRVYKTMYQNDQKLIDNVYEKLSPAFQGVPKLEYL